VAPQHAVGVLGAVLLGVDACHDPWRHMIYYVALDVTWKVALTCSNLVELRGFEPRIRPAETGSELR
jgi:hypothetical protein